MTRAAGGVHRSRPESGVLVPFGLVALIGASIALLAGCTTVPEGPGPAPPWHGRDLAEDGWEHVVLEAGWSLELDYASAVGQTLSWDWFVEQRLPIDFDLHTHAGSEVQLLYARSAVEDRGDHVIDRDAVHSLMWTNPDEHSIEVWFRPDPGFRGTLLPPS